MSRARKLRQERKAATVAAPPARPTVPPLPSRVLWPGALVVAVLAAAVHAAALGFGFLIWDDNLNVTENPHLKLPLGASLQRFWSAGYFGLYVPVTYTSWRLLAELFGIAAPAFHGANVALHALNTALVYVVLRLLLHALRRDAEAPARLDLAALLGALLFAWHPLQVESVAWVSEHRGVLSASLGLLALVCTTRGLPSRLPTVGETAAGLVLFLLAVLAKPSAVAWPLILAVVWRAAGGQAWRTVLRLCAPWLAAAVVAALVTTAVQNPETMSFVPPLLQRPFIAGDALAFYMVKTAVPLGLCAEYGRSPEAVQASGHIRWTWLLPAAAAVGVFLLRPRHSALALGAGWALAALLPVLGLAPFIFQARSTVADRYAYLAIVGVAVVLSTWAASGRGWRLGLLATLVVACAVLAVSRQRVWAADEPFFRDMIVCNPRSTVGHNDLAKTLAARGDTGEALALYRRTLEIRPGDLVAITNVSAILVGRGDCDQAVPLIRNALATIRPSSNNVRSRTALRTNLGSCLQRLGRPDEAAAEYAEAVAIDPHNAVAAQALRNQQR